MRELILNDYFLAGMIVGAIFSFMVSSIIYLLDDRRKRNFDDYKRKSDSFWDQICTSQPPKPIQKHVLLPSGIKRSRCNGSMKIEKQKPRK